MTHAESLPADHDARQRIVDELDTTMLVESAAGTGKTTSMISRMVALIAKGRCQVDSMAAVTYTRKAAAEMRSRFQVSLEQAAQEAAGEERARLAEAVSQIEQCFIGTIHSFCARLLRERPIEAGVDLAFQELEPDADAVLRERAWREHVAKLFAEDDPVLLELEELGVQIDDLQSAFSKFVEYPDVEAWPAPAVELGNLEPLRKSLEDYVQHMQTLVPTFPVDRGNDKLMTAYEDIVRLARNRDLSRPVELMEVLERFRSAKAVQKEWPGGKDQGKQEARRWDEFVSSTVEPTLQQWRQKRYATVMPVLEAACAHYDQLRQQSGGLNYQDLLLRASALLRDKPAIRRYFRSRFSHLLVDEFQDTDPIQGEVMLFLTADDPEETDWQKCRPVAGSLFVVGDPKQSIYRFRRADIVAYDQVKQIIENSSGAIVSLTTNFRTCRELVEWGNTVFDQAFPEAADMHSPAHCPMEVGRTGDDTGDLRGLRILGIPNTFTKKDDIVAHEAELLARCIRRALDEGLRVPRSKKEQNRGIGPEAAPGDFLVVTRNKKHLALYAQKLQELAIPHQVSGGRALGQVSELQLLADCLAALAEPDNPVALVSVLRGELFGLSDLELYAYKRAGGRFSFRASIPEDLDGETRSLFEEAFSRLRRYSSWLNHLPSVPALERIAGDLGLIARAAAAVGGNIQAGSVGKAFQVLRAAQARIDSLGDLAEYLTELIEQNVEFDGLPARPHEGTVVRLMNLHKVKGLEAPVVFLADPTGKWDPPVELHVDRTAGQTAGYMAIRGRGRSGKLLAHPPDWATYEQTEKRFEEAEETRLRYVAATRAGVKMTLTVPDNTKSHRWSPWKFFHPYFDGCESLPDPGPRAVPAADNVKVIDGELSAAWQEIQQRWETVGTPNYATAAAKQIAVTAAGLHHHAHRSGPHGTEWGTVIHFLLEVRMREPTADLDELAYAALVEQELDPELATEAVGAVDAVVKSEIWKRATNSQKRLTEVPFVRRVPAEEDAHELPTVLRGVIDLAFSEAGGWVLVDYKTDAASGDRLPELVEHYRGQVRSYAENWQQMVGEDVNEAGLFFTATGDYVTV